MVCGSSIHRPDRFLLALPGCWARDAGVEMCQPSCFPWDAAAQKLQLLCSPCQLFASSAVPSQSSFQQHETSMQRALQLEEQSRVCEDLTHTLLTFCGKKNITGKDFPPQNRGMATFASGLC